MSEIHRACVLGDGNSAHVVAGLIASLPDWECHVYAPWQDRAELWRAGLERGGLDVCYGPDDGNAVIHGAPAKVSADAADVVPGCRLVIMCLAALAYDDHMRAAAPHIAEGAAIGTICGVNAVDWCIDEAMAAVGRSPDTYEVFALQNLPWACRVDAMGEKVSVLGTKPFMEMTGRPAGRVEALSVLLSGLLRLPLPPVSGGFLGIGLSNLCQVIHPPVMYTNFAGWDGVTPYDRAPLFYQGLSQDAADQMASISEEIFAVRAEIERRVPGLEMTVVHHIFDWCMRAYGKYITDDSTLRSRFATNKAYAGLTCPMRPAPGGDGLVPDFGARYLSEDVPYNLVALRGVAELVGVETPTIDLLITWAQEVMGTEYLVDGRLAGKDIGRSFAPARFGYKRFEDIPEVHDWLHR